MLRLRSVLLTLLLRWFDVALVVAAFVAAWLHWGGAPDPDGETGRTLRFLMVGLAACMPWPLMLESLGLYRSQRRQDFARMVGMVLMASSVPVASVGAAAWFAGVPGASSFAIACGAAQIVALVIERGLIYAVLRRARRSGRNLRYVVIVGSGPRAALVTSRIERHPEWGLRIVAYVDDQGAPLAEEIPPASVHKLHDLGELLASHVIDEVIVACPRSMIAGLDGVASLCASMGLPLTVLADLFGDYMPLPRIGSLGRELTLSFAPVHHGQLALATKRVVDIVGAGAALVACVPILAAAALAVRFSSPGPVFFRQLRCGLYGRKFRMLKFRTMCDGAEDLQVHLCDRNEMDGPVFKLRDDPRTTPVGRVLRRFSIDEMPQLWNVLRGEMSLVGPRPPIPSEVCHYDPAERRRLSMRPGLTCLWQVSGRNSIGFDEWVKLDLEYIDHWSLGLDLVLLIRTIPAVLSGRGAS